MKRVGIGGGARRSITNHPATPEATGLELDKYDELLDKLSVNDSEVGSDSGARY